MEASLPPAGFANPVARHVWETKYRYRDGARILDADLDATWRRVAQALAVAEPPEERAAWAEKFHALLAGFSFLPGGRILAGAGTRHRVTLFNCFAMGPVPDSLDGIFNALHESAVTLQQGGGIGCDFSTLRPAGHPAWTTGNTASGPVSFMRIWNEMAGTIQSLGRRRSAMMATLRCDHPDILDFIAAKRNGGLEHFNLSVQCTDEFMRAVAEDAPWQLVFPADTWHDGGGADGTAVQRRWPGREGLVRCRVTATLPARRVWDALAQAAADCGDPGVLFVDRINQENNLWYDEYLTTTNPCGEVPLPAYGACNLGSFNLARFVQHPFTAHAAFDFERLRTLVPVAVRLLDDALDVSLYPLPAQQERVRRSRRIGLGVTALADALIMLGLPYDSEPARTWAASVFELLRDEAYLASIALAQARGPFPAFDPDYLSAPFINRLPDRISGPLTAHGIRNSHLIAVAPTGTVSLLAGNVSSGIEPVLAFRVRRRIGDAEGEPHDYPLTDYAFAQWEALHGTDAPDSPVFATAATVTASAQLAMLEAIQPFVDNAISKTVNLPPGSPRESAAGIFHQAYAGGLKGCTVFVRNPTRGVIQPEARHEDR